MNIAEISARHLPDKSVTAHAYVRQQLARRTLVSAIDPLVTREGLQIVVMGEDV
jgi:hypothetical protein